jgi:hypothetical protein
VTGLERAIAQAPCLLRSQPRHTVIVSLKEHAPCLAAAVLAYGPVRDAVETWADLVFEDPAPRTEDRGYEPRDVYELDGRP